MLILNLFFNQETSVTAFLYSHCFSFLLFIFEMSVVLGAEDYTACLSKLKNNKQISVHFYVQDLFFNTLKNCMSELKLILNCMHQLKM